MTKFLQFESQGLLDSLNISSKLIGWQNIIKDKCLNNELMDVKSINMPDFSKDLTHNDIYIFAGFQKPGYHQVVIYDPKLERAFCKELMINVNLREDLYPEFPVI